MNDFVPTHTVPDGGLPSWEEPDPKRPSARLDAGLAVQVVETAGAWQRVVCSNGWSTWVDGTTLVPVGAPNGSGSEDDLPNALDDAMAQVGALVADLKAGRIDEDAFRREAFRTGLVLRESEAWILDLDTERWWRYDGLGLTTIAFAMSSGEG